MNRFKVHTTNVSITTIYLPWFGLLFHNPHVITFLSKLLFHKVLNNIKLKLATGMAAVHQNINSKDMAVLLPMLILKYDSAKSEHSLPIHTAEDFRMNKQGSAQDSPLRHLH